MDNENGVEPAMPMWQPAVVCIATSVLSKLKPGQWALPNPTESYGRAWDGWDHGRGGALELPPIADPDAKATLPRTNLDEMHARGHITSSQYAIACPLSTQPIATCR
jgi:hypothetical protein